MTEIPIERPPRSVLIINPNSTASMTDSLKPLVDKLKSASPTNEHKIKHDFFTAPTGPKSINNEDDAAESATHCLPHLLPLLHTHDAFLICCYSHHPLVPLLKARPEIANSRKLVTGIFEASLSSSLQLIHPSQRFGVVSTGKVWETLLSDAVRAYLGGDAGATQTRFAGVQTTGLSAVELHDMPAPEVRRRMKDAVKRLVGRPGGDAKGDVGAICLGCAGMAGMDEIVREACVEALGEEEGRAVRIVDGVVAGVAWLDGALRSGV
ncbi:hydantoin racemase-like protein [Delphinella strobiligena]|nr:hydantoin racemase-like protein [Delphinella strobiligena]